MGKLKQVIVYTDGACTRNPGPGGYGSVLLYGKQRRELYAGYRKTTNNRMEIWAVIKGLEALKQKCYVTLYSDSKYVVEAMRQGWARRWSLKGWKRNKKEKAMNPDLWDRLLKLCEYHQVEFRWVRGHSGNPENERCNQLAVQASQQPNLLVDEVYEDTIYKVA